MSNYWTRVVKCGVELAQYLLDSLGEKAKEEALRQRQIQEITREVFEQRRDAYRRLA